MIIAIGVVVVAVDTLLNPLFRLSPAPAHARR